MTGTGSRIEQDVVLGGWEQVFSRAPLGMAVVVGRRFVRVNAATCDLLGMEAADLEGAEASVIAGIVAGDQLDRAIEAFTRGERRMHLEVRLTRPDGGIRWLAIDVVVVDTPAGEPPTSLITLSDVTGLYEARMRLAGSESRFRTLLTNISDTVSLTDADGKLLYTTGADSSLLGYDEPFWHEFYPIDLVHPDDRDIAIAGWQAALERPREEVGAEVRMQAADGSWQHISVTGVNLLDDPDVQGIVITSRNITALRVAEQLASSQAAVLELIARGEPLPVVAEACIELLEANGMGGASSIYLLDGDALELHAGHAPESLRVHVRSEPRAAGRSICDQAIEATGTVVVDDFDAIDLPPALRAIVDAEGIAASWSQPILAIGSGVPVGSLSTIYRSPQAPSEHERQLADVACSLMAIALERAENEDRLAHQALHDGLTGLPNRTLLLDRLDHALARRARSDARITLLFCDIDRFKVVNDSLGHGVGDQLLVAFADRLRGAVEPGDTVARFGGDEFVLLVEEDAPGRAESIAAQVAASLERPFLLPSGNEVFLTVSIGLAVATDHATGDAWLRDADAAMYRAKERGRNRLVTFDHEMRDAAMVRLEVESDLRRAVERGELVVHYQPFIDVASGRIAGAEALVRWDHPERGLIGPGEFIEVAEDIGTIAELGRFVLDEAVAAVSRLVSPTAERPFQLGVNVSGRQLAGPGLREQVAEVLERHGWPGPSLLLEITESVLVPGLDHPMEQLAKLDDLGVSLALDDFGTGYSSLSRLGRLPVDQVKIDQTFIQALDRPGDRLARVVDAVVAVAAALDLHVTAEGVETQAQLDALRRRRCTYAQGFLFSRAVPIEQLAELLEADPRW